MRGERDRAGLVDVVVVGAHLSGQPLNAELLDRGASLVATVRTAPVYRLWALDTEPPKPGMLRVRSGGAAVLGERWRLPVAAFGGFAAAVVAPLTIGSVELDDGERLPGFLVEPSAVEDAHDITAWGGWVAYLDALGPAGSDRPGARPSRSSIRASRTATAASLPWSVGA